MPWRRKGAKPALPAVVHTRPPPKSHPHGSARVVLPLAGPLPGSGQQERMGSTVAWVFSQVKITHNKGPYLAKRWHKANVMSDCLNEGLR